MSPVRLDKRSPIPLYHQLQAIIDARIASGEWAPGRQLPSERELCEEFGVSRIVVRHDLGRASWLHWGSDANQGMIAEFVAAVREQREPAVTGLDGYRALEVTLAAYQSAASGEPVRL